MGIDEKNQFDNFDDAQLVQTIVCGNEFAMDELIFRYAKVINKQAAFYCGKFGNIVEADDLKQEGMIGLLFAIEGFSKEKGASFKTYAVRCIAHSMLGRLRYESRASRVPADKMVYFDSNQYDFIKDSQDSDPEDLFITREKVKRLYDLIDKRLTPFEKKTFLAYLGGSSYAEIAKGLDTSQKAVDNALQRVRRKLRS